MPGAESTYGSKGVIIGSMAGSLDALWSALRDLVEKNPFGPLAVPGAIVATIALWAGARRLFKASPIGKRRQLRGNLKKLACGVPIEYMDALFGAASGAQKDGDRIYRVYRTKEVYVYVTAPHKDDGVDAYAVTFRRRFFRFRVSKLTTKQLGVKLPKARFSDVSTSGIDGYRFACGSRRFGYAESYYFGNPGRYLTYVLAYNDAGFGKFSASFPKGIETSAGTLSDPLSSETSNEIPHEVPEFRSFRARVTVNTLGVTTCSELSILAGSASVGVDLDKIRLAPD